MIHAGNLCVFPTRYDTLGSLQELWILDLGIQFLMQEREKDIGKENICYSFFCLYLGLGISPWGKLCPGDV